MTKKSAILQWHYFVTINPRVILGYPTPIPPLPISFFVWYFPVYLKYLNQNEWYFTLCRRLATGYVLMNINIFLKSDNQFVFQQSVLPHVQDNLRIASTTRVVDVLFTFIVGLTDKLTQWLAELGRSLAVLLICVSIPLHQLATQTYVSTTSPMNTVTVKMTMILWRLTSFRFYLPWTKSCYFQPKALDCLPFVIYFTNKVRLS